MDQERADGADADLEVVPWRREHQRVRQVRRDGDDNLRDDVAVRQDGLVLAENAPEVPVDPLALRRVVGPG